LTHSHRGRVITRWLASLVLGAVFASPAAAQESREDIIAKQQAEKATNIKPPETSEAERIYLGVKSKLLEAPNGFYPYFDSVYSGGGFTLGGGYRHYYGDRSLINLKGLYSLTQYKLIELSTESPGHFGGKLDLRGMLGWRDATQVGYYGLGTAQTSVDDRANFRFEQTYVGAEARVHPVGWVVFGAGVNYEEFDTKEGEGNFPSIEQVYTPETAPGLGADPKYLHSIASAGIDWRPAPGYARRGGLYEVRYHNYADRDETFSFDRVDGEIVQHLPLLRENWVVSLHGLVQTTLDDDDAVPYFLLPSLGSGSSLRAFQSWRFRDRHSLLLQAEWRWIPNRTGFDVALFADAGKVTRHRSDLDLEHLKSDFGIGFRFHGPAFTPLRIEFAKGNEGLQIVFAGSAAF
jgi:hypothetical protein